MPSFTPLRYLMPAFALAARLPPLFWDYFSDAISPREIKELSLHKSYSPEDPFTDFSITLFRELISGPPAAAIGGARGIIRIPPAGSARGWRTSSDRSMHAFR